MHPLDILIVRHGIAGDRDEFAATGLDDGARPLTEQGRRKMRKGARGLQVLVPKLGAVASSPLVRARETAEILTDAYGLKPVRLDALAPGGEPEALLPFLESERGALPVALVGHEPDLGRLAAWMLAGGGDFMPLKKGGACLIRFARKAAAGRGKLVWALPPRLLRTLAG